MKLKNIIAVFSSIFLVLSAFFVSAGLTGRAISGMEIQTVNIIGAIFFILALFGYYIYFRMR